MKNGRLHKITFGGRSPTILKEVNDRVSTKPFTASKPMRADYSTVDPANAAIEQHVSANVATGAAKRRPTGSAGPERTSSGSNHSICSARTSNCHTADAAGDANLFSASTNSATTTRLAECGLANGSELAESEFAATAISIKQQVKTIVFFKKKAVVFSLDDAYTPKPSKPRRAGLPGMLKALGEAEVQVTFGMLPLARHLRLFAKKTG